MDLSKQDTDKRVNSILHIDCVGTGECVYTGVEFLYKRGLYNQSRGFYAPVDYCDSLPTKY